MAHAPLHRPAREQHRHEDRTHSRRRPQQARPTTVGVRVGVGVAVTGARPTQPSNASLRLSQSSSGCARRGTPPSSSSKKSRQDGWLRGRRAAGGHLGERAAPTLASPPSPGRIDRPFRQARRRPAVPHRVRVPVRVRERSVRPVPRRVGRRGRRRARGRGRGDAHAQLLDDAGVGVMEAGSCARSP